jgi:hypothetical protein
VYVLPCYVWKRWGCDVVVRWIDKGTRAIAHTFNVYNTNSRLLTACRFMVEIFESGSMIVSRGTCSLFVSVAVTAHAHALARPVPPTTM